MRHHLTALLLVLATGCSTLPDLAKTTQADAKTHSTSPEKERDKPTEDVFESHTSQYSLSYITTYEAPKIKSVQLPFTQINHGARIALTHPHTLNDGFITGVSLGLSRKSLSFLSESMPTQSADFKLAISVLKNQADELQGFDLVHLPEPLVTLEHPSKATIQTRINCPNVLGRVALKLMDSQSGKAVWFASIEHDVQSYLRAPLVKHVSLMTQYKNNELIASSAQITGSKTTQGVCDSSAVMEAADAMLITLTQQLIDKLKVVN